VLPVGGTDTLTLSLDTALPVDTTVALRSADTAVASVPAAVTIPARQTSTTFYVTGAATGGPVSIRATLPAELGSGTASAVVGVGVTLRTVYLAQVLR
jgi:hypothetical protein